ncbi:hypothetical protein FO519_008459, partial [Halicephalobus sp. NKZ332]
PNSINYPIVFCGAALLGHPVCGVNPDSTKEELKNFAEKTEAKFVVCSSESLNFVKNALFSKEIKIFVFGKKKASEERIVFLDSEFLGVSFDEDVTTTLSARSRALTTPDDILLAPLSSGSTGDPKFPSLVVFLSKNKEKFGSFNLKTLKTILCGSAPIGKKAIEEFLEKYPHVEEFVQGYGMTEIVCLSHLIPLENSAKDKKHFGSCGKLLEGFEAMLVDPETHEIRTHPGESGELWLRSDSVMKGYFKDDEENSKILESSGWMKTGDVLYFDEDGFYFVVDRLKNMIKVNGIQVAPVELENIFLELDFVSEVSVIGIQDADFGEVPVAFIVLKKEEIKNITLQEAVEISRNHVHSKVAPHKQLRGGIIVVEELPKTSTGKVIKKELQSLAMAEHETVL